MKKFILNSFLIIGTALLINLILGLCRLHVNDEIPFAINKINAGFMPTQAHGFINGVFQGVHYGDLNGEGINNSWLKLDSFGFSNIIENKTPTILYVGDSFFFDPGHDTRKGIQALTNNKLQKNLAYNIGAATCSGFRTYNELIKQSSIRKPKLLIFEVIERNAEDVLTNMYADLLNDSLKTIRYKYYYLDLLLGDNFYHLNKTKLISQQITQPPHKINGNNIWFLTNFATLIDDSTQQKIVASMKKVQSFLDKQGIKIVFVIAPDKESLYPEIFGSSSLNKLQHLIKDNGVNNIDMYSILRNNRMRLYYDGDTHWNQEALNILTDSVCAKYNSMLSR